MDTTTPVGRLQAQIVASVAEFERARISERCRDAAKAKRARGERVGGVGVTALSTVQAVVSMRQDGLALSAIASELNAQGVATARGGKSWYASSVKALLESERGRELLAA